MALPASALFARPSGKPAPAKDYSGEQAALTRAGVPESNDEHPVLNLVERRDAYNAVDFDKSRVPTAVLRQLAHEALLTRCWAQARIYLDDLGKRSNNTEPLNRDDYCISGLYYDIIVDRIKSVNLKVKPTRGAEVRMDDLKKGDRFVDVQGKTWVYQRRHGTNRGAHIVVDDVGFSTVFAGCATVTKV